MFSYMPWNNPIHNEIRASSGNLYATTILLKFGVSTDHIDPKGQNVLHRAVMGSEIGVLETILITACLRKPQSCNHTSLKTSSSTEADVFRPCSECSLSDSVRTLLHQEDSYGWPPLAFAAMRIVQQLPTFYFVSAHRST